MALTERNVFSRLIFSSVLLIVSLVTSGVVWGHWAYTLDTCPGYNCGCILFGVGYDKGFAGGQVEYCQYITYSQIPVFITSVVLIFYFGYRVFIQKRKNEQRVRRKDPLLALRNKNARTQGSSVILDSQPPDELVLPSMPIRIGLLVLSILMALFLISAAVLSTWGFYSSCKEIRKLLVKELQLTGNSAEVVEGRIACTSIYDFLDYLQPDRIDFDQPLHQGRQDRINTGICLMLAKSALFMNFINWIFMTTFHIKSVRNRQKNVSYNND